MTSLEFGALMPFKEFIDFAYTGVVYYSVLHMFEFKLYKAYVCGVHMYSSVCDRYIEILFHQLTQMN